ncbi:MAG: ATP-binding protein [Kiritimatiellia bacterium]
MLEKVAEVLPLAIVLTDKAQNIIYTNPAFSLLHGYQPEEMKGKSPACLKSDEQDPAAYQDIQQALLRQEAWSGQLRNRTKDGQNISLEVTISPFVDEKGACIGHISVARDLTTEIQLETQLRHAQKMEAIGTLAGGIAHDFNNILSAIIGYTELAIQDSQNHRTASANLMQILKAAKRAAELISQILTFSRRSSNTRQALYLKPILGEALKLLRGTLPSSTVIIADLAENTPPVLADATQMHQVIMNLCTNASQAMQPQGGTLTVRLTKETILKSRPAWQQTLPEGVECIALRVSDTGPGIPAAIQAKIFEPYFTTKQGGDGTGLGLATVHGIVTSHAGTIHVDSKPGTGTTFTILLPTCAPENVFPDPPPTETPLPRGNNEMIMVVDDEESLTIMISTSLTYLGYQVESHCSSVQALAAFEANPEKYDCIISDQTMPTLNGADLARRVLAIRPDLPFILSTGYSPNMNEKIAREIGISQFILKPTTGRNLATSVATCLQKRTRHANPSTHT